MNNSEDNGGATNKEPVPPETTISYCKRASEKLINFEKKISTEKKSLLSNWAISKDKK